jgi:hypothetical protein
LELENIVKAKDKKEFVHFNKKTKFSFYLISNNKFFQAFTYVNEKEMKKYLFIETMDKSSLQQNGDIKKISEIDLKDKNARTNSIVFNYLFSPDKSKILIYGVNVYEKTKGVFSYTVVDADFNVLWEKQIDFTLEENQKDVSFVREFYTGIPVGLSFHLSRNTPYLDLFIDNEANIYSINIFSSNKEESGQYQITKFFDNGKNTEEFPIELSGNKKISHIKSTTNPEGNIVCLGYYSNDEISTINGIFYLLIDVNTKKIIQEEYLDYDYNLKESYSLVLHNLIQMKDGRIILLSEPTELTRVKEKKMRYDGSIDNDYYYIHNYGSINIVVLSENAKLERYKIHKQYELTTQASISELGSFSYHIVDDNIYFIYNETHNNNNNNNKTTITLFNTNGETSKKALNTQSELKVLTYQRMSDSKMFFLGTEKEETLNFVEIN